MLKRRLFAIFWLLELYLRTRKLKKRRDIGTSLRKFHLLFSCQSRKEEGFSIQFIFFSRAQYTLGQNSTFVNKFKSKFLTIFRDIKNIQNTHILAIFDQN